MTRIEITDPADWQVGDHARIEWPGKIGGSIFCIEGPVIADLDVPGDLKCGGHLIRTSGSGSAFRPVTVTREVPDEGAP